MTLQTYYWDMPIGQAVAVATDVHDARRQLMATLSPDDAARGELEVALSAEPTLLGGERQALVAWHP